MRKLKGCYGYRDKRKKRLLILTLLFLAAILIQLWARTLTADVSKKNILTVMAVLTVLPMANIASPLIASWRFHTPPESFYRAVKAHEKDTCLLYDLLVTSKEYILPFDAVAIYPETVCCYLNSKKADANKAQEYIEQMLRDSRISMGVKVIKDETVFMRRLESGKTGAVQEPTGAMEQAAALLKQLCM